MEPWWAPDRDDVEAPPNPFADRDDGDLRFHESNTAPRRGVVLSTVVFRLAKLTDDDALLESWLERAWPEDILVDYASPSALDRWRPFLWSVFASGEELAERERPDRYIRIGRLPDECESGQVDLEAVVDGSITGAVGSVNVDDFESPVTPATGKSIDDGVEGSQ